MFDCFLWRVLGEQPVPPVERGLIGRASVSGLSEAPGSLTGANWLWPTIVGVPAIAIWTAYYKKKFSPRPKIAVG